MPEKMEADGCKSASSNLKTPGLQPMLEYNTCCLFCKAQNYQHSSGSTSIDYKNLIVTTISFLLKKVSPLVN